MSALPRVPRNAPAPPRTIVLPSWLTPDFARRWLKRVDALGKGHRSGQAYSQEERYRAIARSMDWDERRGYALVWSEPYAGRAFADPIPVPADEAQAARQFAQLARMAIHEGWVSADEINVLLEGRQKSNWNELVTALEALLARTRKPARRTGAGQQLEKVG